MSVHLAVAVTLSVLPPRLAWPNRLQVLACIERTGGAIVDPGGHAVVVPSSIQGKQGLAFVHPPSPPLPLSSDDRKSFVIRSFRLLPFPSLRMDSPSSSSHFHHPISCSSSTSPTPASIFCGHRPGTAMRGRASTTTQFRPSSNSFNRGTFAFAFSSLPSVLLVALSLLLSLQNGLCLVSFFSADDLKYTFGVDHLTRVPPYRLVSPRLIPRPRPVRPDEPMFDLYLQLSANERPLLLSLYSVTDQLLADRFTTVRRTRPDGGGFLQMEKAPRAMAEDCHFHHRSEHILAAISNCDGWELKGTIIRNGSVHVLHPIPAHHMARVRRSTGDRTKALHVLYRREAKSGEDFCGIENTISSEELVENEAGVHEDAFVAGQKLMREGDLLVELAVFVDEQLWRHFSSKYGSLAWQKLQQYTLTMLSNIQIMYRQPTAVPSLTFRVVRYEVYQTQPSAIASYLHENGNAQRYLDMFCRYQRNLGARDWDHALMLTGFDIHRGYGATSISGIARLDGMCDSWNSCTLAEGLDFTSAFIGTHELGHAVGMRHDEPYCSGTFIMSASLGPGKVTWSSCSMRDYQSFIQRLDARQNNCMRTSLLREQLPLTESLKPGQIYDAHEQCRLMHGPSYVQVSPRQDHYDGICHMIWCGQSNYGRIITSHPALEGTHCGANQWCSLGRCVPWNVGFVTPLAPRPSLQAAAIGTLAAFPTTTPVSFSSAPGASPGASPGGANPAAWHASQPAEIRAKYLRSLAEWRARTELPNRWPMVGVVPFRVPRVFLLRYKRRHRSCESATCGAFGEYFRQLQTLSQRNCSNPAPLNGGVECSGPAHRAAVCARKCPQGSQSVDQFISAKCSEHKRTRQDPELTGTGSQLSRFPQRACKVFCDVINPFGAQRNYRFYGDNLPDGAPCGVDRYCLNGECTIAHKYFWRDCLRQKQRTPNAAAPFRRVSNGEPPPPADGVPSGKKRWRDLLVIRCLIFGEDIGDYCPSSEQKCPAAQPDAEEVAKGHWEEWSFWSPCTASCGHTGIQLRSRTCSGANHCEGEPSSENPVDSVFGELWSGQPGPLPSMHHSAERRGLYLFRVAMCGDNGAATALRPMDGMVGVVDLFEQLRARINSAHEGVFAGSVERLLVVVWQRNAIEDTCPAGSTCPGTGVEQQPCNEQPCDQSADSQTGLMWSPPSATKRNAPCRMPCGAAGGTGRPAPSRAASVCADASESVTAVGNVRATKFKESSAQAATCTNARGQLDKSGGQSIAGMLRGTAIPNSEFNLTKFHQKCAFCPINPREILVFLRSISVGYIFVALAIMAVAPQSITLSTAGHSHPPRASPLRQRRRFFQFYGQKPYKMSNVFAPKNVPVFLGVAVIFCLVQTVLLYYSKVDPNLLLERLSRSKKWEQVQLNLGMNPNNTFGFGGAEGAAVGGGALDKQTEAKGSGGFIGGGFQSITGGSNYSTLNTAIESRQYDLGGVSGSSGGGGGIESLSLEGTFGTDYSRNPLYFLSNGVLMIAFCVASVSTIITSFAVKCKLRGRQENMSDKSHGEMQTVTNLLLLEAYLPTLLVSCAGVNYVVCFVMGESVLTAQEFLGMSLIAPIPVLFPLINLLFLQEFRNISKQILLCQIWIRKQRQQRAAAECKAKENIDEELESASKNKLCNKRMPNIGGVSEQIGGQQAKSAASVEVRSEGAITSNSSGMVSEIAQRTKRDATPTHATRLTERRGLCSASSKWFNAGNRGNARKRRPNVGGRGSTKTAPSFEISGTVTEVGTSVATAIPSADPPRDVCRRHFPPHGAVSTDWTAPNILISQSPTLSSRQSSPTPPQPQPPQPQPQHQAAHPKMASSYTISAHALPAFLLVVLFAFHPSSSQPAAWPSTSYSPYFQSLFSAANSPVAAFPSGAGAQAPAIPVSGEAALPLLHSQNQNLRFIQQFPPPFPSLAATPTQRSFASSMVVSPKCLLLPQLLLLFFSPNSLALVKRQSIPSGNEDGAVGDELPVGYGGTDPPPSSLNEPITAIGLEQAEDVGGKSVADIAYDAVEEQPTLALASASSAMPEGTGMPPSVKPSLSESATSTAQTPEAPEENTDSSEAVTTEPTTTTPSIRRTVAPKKEIAVKERKGHKTGTEFRVAATTAETTPEGTTSTPSATQPRNCNSERMRKLIIENIHAKPSIAKRQIQSKVAAEINGKIDVICAKHAFSYIVNSELFCEAERYGVICLCFKQQG
ncbi:hypothetical protein GPALN_011197 [Globodera pallida]|nr:hypothetical protein GPALN_011197 [Globodera pallida]